MSQNLNLSELLSRKGIAFGKLSSLGFDSKLFGAHSIMASGASAAANASELDRLFKQYGCWRSESAKDRYVKDSEEAFISVSGSLKL